MSKMIYMQFDICLMSGGSFLNLPSPSMAIRPTPRSFSIPSPSISRMSEELSSFSVLSSVPTLLQHSACQWTIQQDFS
jgi:hypothetical protein